MHPWVCLRGNPTSKNVACKYVLFKTIAIGSAVTVWLSYKQTSKISGIWFKAVIIFRNFIVLQDFGAYASLAYYYATVADPISIVFSV